MEFNKKELAFILYNNRSSKMILNHVSKDMDLILLQQIEEQFDWIKSLHDDLDNFVEINASELSNIGDDLKVTKNDIIELTELVKSSIMKFSDFEREFLEKRKIPESILRKWSIFGLSNIKKEKDLISLGATCHPILRNILKDGIEEGGICQPLFENGILTNCSIRRITDVGKLKYTLAVPDVPVWGLDGLREGSEAWISEGIFDAMALKEMGVNSVTPSSAMWSGIQLLKLIDKKPSKIVIMVDNDNVGMKNGMILKRFFRLRGIESITVHSEFGKDAAEHFFEKNKSISDLKEIEINKDMVRMNKDNSFNFLEHLKNRKF